MNATNFKLIFVCVQVGNERFIIIGTYFPPNSDVSAYM